MGVTPPESKTLVGPRPVAPGYQDCRYDSCNFVPGTAEENAAWNIADAAWKVANDKQRASYQKLDEKIAAFNANLRSRM
ncbi:hypothetical protein L195_g063139, partial [Trifolium pratense]